MDPAIRPTTGFADSLEAVERGAARRDRSVDDLDVAPWVPTCIFETDPNAARDGVRSLVAFYVGAMGEYYADAATAHGFGDEAAAIRDGWKADRQAGAEAAVTDKMIDAFGAAGTPAEATESFEQFAEAGVDSPIARVPTKWTDVELVRETIAHL